MGGESMHDWRGVLGQFDFSRLWPADIVLVCDLNGRVHAMSDAAVRLAQSASGLKTLERGRLLSDVMPEAAANERVMLGSRAMATRAPVRATAYAMGRRVEYLFVPCADPEMFAFVLFPASTPSEAFRVDAAQAHQMTHVCADPYGSLSNLELTVLRLIAMSLTNKQIAARLCRTKRAVEWHTRNLLRKLGESSRIGLFRIAFDAGLNAFDDAHWEAIMAVRKNDLHHGGSMTVDVSAARPVAVDDSPAR